jgi:hypothetical protein
MRGGGVTTMNWRNMKFRFASLILLGIATLSLDAAAAHDPPKPCPKPTTPAVEPSPCAVQRQPNYVNMTCDAPGPYWFYTDKGLGCAGGVSNIKLEIGNIQLGSGRQNQYILTYRLYTGNGFHSFDDGVHIDALLKNGTMMRDILAPRFKFNTDYCYYAPGQDFRISNGGFPIVTNFDITAHPIQNIHIRVDSASGAGWNVQC